MKRRNIIQANNKHQNWAVGSLEEIKKSLSQFGGQT
jgi:hypothetical protein